MQLDKRIEFHNILDLSKEYQEKLALWRNQDFVRTKMFQQEKISEEAHKLFLSKLEMSTSKKVFVSFFEDKPIGVLQYDCYEKDKHLEFGYYLIEEKLLNSGFGIVLEYALLNHAFNDLNMHKVFCRTLSFNDKVINLHKKFGFSTEGILREHIDINGEYIDIYFQGIFFEEWSKKREFIENVVRYIIPIHSIGEIK